MSITRSSDNPMHPETVLTFVLSFIQPLNFTSGQSITKIVSTQILTNFLFYLPAAICSIQHKIEEGDCYLETALSRVQSFIQLWKSTSGPSIIRIISTQILTNFFFHLPAAICSIQHKILKKNSLKTGNGSITCPLLRPAMGFHQRTKPNQNYQHTNFDQFFF